MRKIVLLLAWMATLIPAAHSADELPIEQIKLPPGFRIELWARVESARQLALGHTDRNGGTVFVGSRKAGKVHALSFDGNYKAGKVFQIAEDLSLPVGVAYRDGSLYVSAVDRILRLDDIERRLENPPKPR